MAGEPPITLIGNLTGDPELRFTPSGAAVANFTIACTPRTLDRQSNEWKDGETLFISCAVWRQVAENVPSLCNAVLVWSFTGVSKREAMTIARETSAPFSNATSRKSAQVCATRP